LLAELRERRQNHGLVPFFAEKMMRLHDLSTQTFLSKFLKNRKGPGKQIGPAGKIF
jgi:hypothetical protein